MYIYIYIYICIFIYIYIYIYGKHVLNHQPDPVIRRSRWAPSCSRLLSCQDRPVPQVVHPPQGPQGQLAAGHGRWGRVWEPSGAGKRGVFYGFSLLTLDLSFEKKKQKQHVQRAILSEDAAYYQQLVNRTTRTEHSPPKASMAFGNSFERSYPRTKASIIKLAGTLIMSCTSTLCTP